MSMGKTVLITGVSSGIGRSIARKLAGDGHKVIGTARNPQTIDQIEGVEILPLDVRVDASVAACIRAVLDRNPRIDVLINNAGYVMIGAVEEVSIEEAKAQFETNFFGAMRMIKAVLPAMRARRDGHIINITSLAGLIPTPPFWGLYSASKHALEAYTEHLWREVSFFNVRVSLVEPGPIRTHLTRNQQSPAEGSDVYAPWRDKALEVSQTSEANAPDPSVVADCVARLLSSPSPRLHNRIGKEATWVPRLRCMLSEGQFERVIRRVFNLS